MGEIGLLERVEEVGVERKVKEDICNSERGLRCALRINNILVKLRANHQGFFDIHFEQQLSEARKLIEGVDEAYALLCNGKGCSNDIYREYIERSVRPELEDMKRYAEQYLPAESSTAE